MPNNRDASSSSNGDSSNSSGGSYPTLRYARSPASPSSVPPLKHRHFDTAAAATATAAAAAAAEEEAPHRPADAAGGVGYAAVTVFLIYLKVFDVGPPDVHGAAPYCIACYAASTVLSFCAWQFRSETASALSLVAQQGINLSLNLGDWPFTGQSIALNCWFWALGLIAANHFAVRSTELYHIICELQLVQRIMQRAGCRPQSVLWFGGVFVSSAIESRLLCSSACCCASAGLHMHCCHVLA
jgi:hypothetical protein